MFTHILKCHFPLRTALFLCQSHFPFKTTTFSELGRRDDDKSTKHSSPFHQLFNEKHVEVEGTMRVRWAEFRKPHPLLVYMGICGIFQTSQRS